MARAPRSERIADAVLLGLAILFDLGAVAGLVFAGFAGYQRLSGLFLFAFSGWPFLFVAGAAAALSSVVVVRRIDRTGVSVAIVIVGVVLTVVAGPAALVVGWNLTPNPAIAASAPLRDAMAAYGAKELCERDDPGYGPDNLIPWVATVHRIRAGDDLPERIAQAPESRRLGLRPVAIEGRSNDRDPPDPDAVRLRSGRIGPDHVVVDVTLHHAPTSSLGCWGGGDDYGDVVDPGRGRWIVTVDASGTPVRIR